MARSGNTGAVKKVPEVTFSIEVRPASFAQVEAGKRLFGKLISRAQSQIELENSQKAKGRAKRTRSAPGGAAEAAARLPPTTIRGADFTRQNRKRKKK